MVLLYQHDLTDGALEELYNNLERQEGREIDVFTSEEVEGVLAATAELDAVIDANAEGWKAHRLAALERSILRLAIYEIRERPDIPYEVSIDEAVELAKRFCSPEAGSLINGVLGKVADSGQAAAGDDPANDE